MKKVILGAVIFLMVFFMGIFSAKAADPVSVNCFDYYKFGSVNINITAGKGWVIPKENVKFQGYLSKGRIRVTH